MALELINILDFGYIKHEENWGSDERIIEAARMSTGKGFLGWGPDRCDHCEGSGEVTAWTAEWVVPPRSVFLSAKESAVAHGLRESLKRRVQCQVCNGRGTLSGDEKLLRYLWTHKHGTPFEMAGMTITVQAPIMVFREWHRHRTQSYNEMSARYTPLPDLNYLPGPERCLVVAGKNRQAGKADGSPELTHEAAIEWLNLLSSSYQLAESVYQRGLHLGIPKELARLIVPVGRYSRMMASANLRNWLAFLTLRMDGAAQWEIRQYANAVGGYIRELYPRTWELFVEGKGYDI